jgi:excisionase family DNA binding protein
MSCLGLSPSVETREGVISAFARLIGMREEMPADLTKPDPLLDAQAVAALLGVPPSWVYAETRAGRLPHVRVGRYRRFRRAAIESWVEDHERGPVR